MKLGAVIVDIEGTSLTPEDQELLAHPGVGGIILFARNYESREQLTTLVDAIRAARSQPLLIMVDQEGGRVQRFVKEFTRLPSLSTFGKCYDQHPEMGCNYAKDGGWLMANELLSLGIDLSLGPVLDIRTSISSVIGDRAFHEKPNAVTALATAYVKGMKEAGMAGTGKHFPGHGSIHADSHTALSVDYRTYQEIENLDLIPFAKLIHQGIEAVMAAHIVFPQIDKMAAGYSYFWLNEVLKKRLSFNGAIFSDDLTMEGANISSDYGDRVLGAREAGCDFTLLCNNRKGVVQALDRITIRNHQVSPEKWQPLCGRFTKQPALPTDTIRWEKTRANLIDIMR